MNNFIQTSGSFMPKRLINQPSRYLGQGANNLKRVSLNYYTRLLILKNAYYPNTFPGLKSRHKKPARLRNKSENALFIVYDFSCIEAAMYFLYPLGLKHRMYSGSTPFLVGWSKINDLSGPAERGRMSWLPLTLRTYTNIIAIWMWIRFTFLVY